MLGVARKSCQAAVSGISVDRIKTRLSCQVSYKSCCDRVALPSVALKSR